MSKVKGSLPEDWHSDASWSRADQEQEDERYFEPSPLRIAGLAEFASLILFCGMIAVWLIIGDVNFPEVPQ